MDGELISLLKTLIDSDFIAHDCQSYFFYPETNYIDAVGCRHSKSMIMIIIMIMI